MDNSKLLRGKKMPTVKRPKLELSYHRPEWKVEYTKMVKELTAMIPNYIPVCIMHVGSTAVKGLAARPIIDVAIGVLNPLDLFTVRDIMSVHNFRFSEERSTIFDLFMERRGMGKQRFNIHIVEYEGSRWNDMVEYTNYLKENKQAAKKYAEFKTELLFKKNLAYDEYEAKKAEYLKELKKEYKTV